MTEGKVQLSPREVVFKTLCERLMWVNKQKEAGEVFTIAQVAALVTDDLMSEADVTIILRGTEDEWIEQRTQTQTAMESSLTG